MMRFLARRLAASALLLWLLLTFLFFVLHLAPGSPLVSAPGRSSPEARQRMVELYKLDRPLPEQYTAWISAALLHGDLGFSYAQRRPVTAVIGEALPNTLILACAAFFIDLALGIPLGILAAWRRESRLDHAIRGISLLLYSVPSFWLALMAMLLFSLVWPIFPPGNMLSPGASALPWHERLPDLALHLVLPAAILGLAGCGSTIRLVRSSLLEVLGRDYIRTARAKGLSESRVLVVHALRNAVVPLIQVAGTAFPQLLNGSLIIEVIFSWPGLGRITFQAVNNFDYPLVLGGTALSGVLVVLGALLADLGHAAADPRVRLEKGRESHA